MSSIADLKERVLVAEARVAHLQSLVDAFYSGEVPEVGTFDHHILAKWGRRRLDERVKTAALLASPVPH